MADDKALEIAKKLFCQEDESWVSPEHIAVVIRAELKPLLDAAQAVIAFHSHKSLDECLNCRLAAELRNWRKE